MAGRIPQHFIDELLSRVDVVDIVDAYVPLKKAGKNHHACCPFHDEKTPSFTVSQQKQFYHCFGCGANGSAISFLMEYLHMDFVEAIEDLASRAGMEIPREAIQASQSNNQSSELYELMEMTTAFYSKQLRKHPQAESVINYLKGRGISGEIAAEFELGFAPPGWDNLMTELGGSDNASKRLLKIGAIIENDRGGYYDRFRNRLTFPIRDQRGRAIGVGGRVLDDSKPKYLNSPETPIFHKGRELYGLYQARKALKDVDSLYIVEGYMDVIALAQFGVRNVVASLGTAATPEHLEKLFRLTNKLVFCFDGDAAGLKAAWRGLENVVPILKDGYQISFMFLPDGEDPDSYVRTKGKDDFTNEKHLIPLSQFLFDTLQLDNNCQTPEGQASMVSNTLPYLGKLMLKAPALTSILLTKLNKITEVPLTKLETELQKQIEKGSTPNQPTYNQQVNKKVHTEEDKEHLTKAIKLLLRKPQIALENSLSERLCNIDFKGIKFLIDIVDYIQNNPETTYAGILEKYRDQEKIKNRLTQLAPIDSKYDADDHMIYTSEAMGSELLGILNLMDSESNKDNLSFLDSINSVHDLTDENSKRIQDFISKKLSMRQK